MFDRYVDQWISEPENRPIYEVGWIRDWNVSGLTDLSYVEFEDYEKNSRVSRSNTTL